MPLLFIAMAYSAYRFINRKAMFVVASQAIAVPGCLVGFWRLAVAGLAGPVDASECHAMVLAVAVKALPMRGIWRLRCDIGMAHSATALNSRLLHRVRLMAHRAILVPRRHRTPFQRRISLRLDMAHLAAIGPICDSEIAFCGAAMAVAALLVHLGRLAAKAWHAVVASGALTALGHVRGFVRIVAFSAVIGLVIFELVLPGLTGFVAQNAIAAKAGAPGMWGVAGGAALVLAGRALVGADSPFFLVAALADLVALELEIA